MKTQKEWRKIWVKEIKESPEPEKKLQEILKNQTPTWVRILDILLMTALLVGLIFAHGEGYFNKTEVTITCEELPEWIIQTNDTEVITEWESLIEKSQKKSSTKD